jgi:broad specificity phosphatase PhoE
MPLARHARLFLLPLVLLLSACAAPRAPQPAPTPAAPTTVVVVRHGEKAALSAAEQRLEADPPLSAAGEARSRSLAELLAGARIDAVYATQYRRTQQTAEPTAERFGLTVQTYPASRAVAEDAARLTTEILSRHRGGSVLVVGHSNTVPAIVQALSGQPVDEIDEAVYDNAFVVVIPAAGAARVYRAKYGAR